MANYRALCRYLEILQTAGWQEVQEGADLDTVELLFGNAFEDQRSGLPPIEDGNAGDIDSGVIGRILVNQLTKAGVITDYMHTFAFCADDRSVSADKCLSLYIPYPSLSYSHSEFIANLQ